MPSAPVGPHAPDVERMIGFEDDFVHGPSGELQVAYPVPELVVV
jgi:hypothetical protein